MERKKSVNFSAFTIQPFNPVGFGDGWKNDNDDCYNMTGKDFIQCLTDAAYNVNNIFISNYLRISKEFITPSNYSFNVIPFYVEEWKGIDFSVNMNSGELFHLKWPHKCKLKPAVQIFQLTPYPLAARWKVSGVMSISVHSIKATVSRNSRNSASSSALKKKNKRLSVT